ncbi:MAG TPA: 50S ribosomal protein L16 [Candidatus Paceibacterota bacterium]|jgi:large subunit ribosomal protein L16|nr:50S ribosomal protein L16 [Parcubacteria group bacterium]HOM33116.1 50S ribosomal protein L16 [Candidatus Paceibacterota bacterium]HPC37351.1 50S ribosomal protein L16 [Candidatus Paceibacterota bacterium]HRU35825.1 50S ribosomal protein L16 [Candidatus Paceibacterota bacterium]
MLMPKKLKHRKYQKGRNRKRTIETRGTFLAFGSYGLQSLENIWLTARQIEAGRKAIVGYLKRGGKVWIRVFPDKPITKKPPEVTMGGGKGDVDHYAFPLKKGRIIYEIDGVSEEMAIEALKRASYKMPVKTKIIKK